MAKFFGVSQKSENSGFKLYLDFKFSNLPRPYYVMIKNNEATHKH